MLTGSCRCQECTSCLTSRRHNYRRQCNNKCVYAVNGHKVSVHRHSFRVRGLQGLTLSGGEWRNVMRSEPDKIERAVRWRSNVRRHNQVWRRGQTWVDRRARGKSLCPKAGRSQTVPPPPQCHRAGCTANGLDLRWLVTVQVEGLKCGEGAAMSGPSPL